MINRERLTETFKRLVSIDSVSKEEGALATELAALLSKLGAEIIVDSAWQQTGSDTGNLIARLAGSRDAAPLLLSAHMDTNRIIDSFKKTVCACPGSDDMNGFARIEVFEEKDFSGTHISDDHPIVSIARRAAV
jgi:tripeptide aminopeptidase